MHCSAYGTESCEVMLHISHHIPRTRDQVGQVGRIHFQQSAAQYNDSHTHWHSYQHMGAADSDNDSTVVGGILMVLCASAPTLTRVRWVPNAPRAVSCECKVRVCII